MTAAKRIYLRDLPAALVAIENSIATSNFEEAEKIAHRYKSSSGQVGEKEIAQHFASIEKLAAEGKTSSLPEVLVSLLAAARELDLTSASETSADASVHHATKS
jgi:HPt (histidine-containing phosphotransfer) domain-containing protein